MKMQDQTIPSLFLTALIVLLRTPTSSCADNQTRNGSCPRQPPFECGNINEIDYPFWGGHQPASCGLAGFHLTCREKKLILNTSSIPYRVLDIDPTTQTLRLSRDDLSNTLCAPLHRNTTLDLALFDFSSSADDRNVTLYYGCNSSRPPPSGADRLNCGSGNGSFYLAMEEVDGGACGGSINVPVSQGAARGLKNLPGNVPADVVLKDAIERGFSVQWSVNNDCRNCAQSGGSCQHSNQSFICYCADGPHNFTCNDANPISHAGSTNGTSPSRRYLIIGLSLGIPSGIAISLITFFCIKKQCRRLRKFDQGSNQDIDKVLLHHGSLSPKRYSYNQIKKMTKSFTDKLGRGAFGIVYKGKLPDDGQLVAVKVLTETDDNIAEDFINEVSSISRTSHVNIVNLLGFCYEGKKRALVYEFMPNKSLDNFISKNNNRSRELEWGKMYEIAIGVARGLEYLHMGCNTRIVHFDIKPQNILLDEDLCPKISDFGLAKLFRKKQSMISMLGARGTAGYIAPEVFSRSFGVVSHKSDVYSYGMMLLVMAGAKKAVEIEENTSGEDFFHDKIYNCVLLDDVMAEEKEEVVRKMLLVGVWCIQIAASDRPSMTKVVEMLEGSVESLQIPPKPIFPSPILSPQSSSDSVTLEIE